MEVIDTAPTFVTERTDSDSPWKDILDMYLKDFFDFCLPGLSILIDWTRGWTSLDQELRLLIKQSKNSKHIVDKLIKVFLRSGMEQWILIHIEIQGAVKKFFPERMFVSSYRIYDKYKRSLISCAILTDANKNWRPDSFAIGVGKTKLSLEYEVIKILDYIDKVAELEASMNPFASVILIQLMALQAKKRSPQERYNIKFALTKRLLSKGFTKERIHKLFLFLDWLMNLPEPLEIEYNKEVLKLKEDKPMAYVSSLERYIMKQGWEKGVQAGMEEGRQMGLEEGRQEGRQEGIDQMLTVLNLLHDGKSAEEIAKNTGLSIEQIQQIKKYLH